MNVLAELLPGARQVRTPLAVGYLWLLAAWINAPRVGDKLHKSQLVVRATTDIAHLSPALVLLIVSFVAYIAGLFFEVFDNLLIKLAFILAAAIFGSWAVVVSTEFIQRHLIYMVAILALGVAYTYFYSRHLKTSVDRVLTQHCDNIWLRIRLWYFPIKDIVLRVWSPATPVKNDLVAEQINKLLDGHPKVEEEFCETLSLPALRVACREAGLGDRESRNSTTISKISSAELAKAAEHSVIDPNNEKLLRQYLRDRIAVSQEVRRAVVMRTIIATDIKREVDRSLDHAQVRIQADKPTVFEAYDRLRSDADFRRGVAAPLGVIISSVYLLYSTNRFVAIAAAVPAAVIYFSGMKKQEEAAKVVSHSISAELTSIRLDVTDIKLLRWPTQRSTQELRTRLSQIRSRVTLKRRGSSKANPSDGADSGPSEPSPIESSPAETD